MSFLLCSLSDAILVYLFEKESFGFTYTFTFLETMWFTVYMPTPKKIVLLKCFSFI